jgi:hypothetical protein
MAQYFNGTFAGNFFDVDRRLDYAEISNQRSRRFATPIPTFISLSVVVCIH